MSSSSNFALFIYLLIMTTTSKSFGVSIGRAIGYSAAAVAHGAAVSVKATGQFGADVVAGTTEGYTEHAARFAALRMEVAKARPASIAIKAKATAKA